MDPTQTQDPQQQIDIAAIQKKATEDAQAAADAKIQQMKDDLARSISGKSGYETPKTWEELENRSVSRSTAEAERIAEEKVKAALDARDKAEEEKTKQTLAQTEAQQKTEWEQMSREWSEAVADGVIPDIKLEIKQKLMADPDYSKLTPEEQNDPGLKAYNEGRILHGQLKQQGKSTSFYRTLEKFYGKMPAGATAPVLGGSTPTPQPSEEFDYDAVKANRKAKLGW
jgi:hypothetical protein